MSDDLLYEMASCRFAVCPEMGQHIPGSHSDSIDISKAHRVRAGRYS